MTRVLFIHGTMTRYDANYVRTQAIMRERLQGWRADCVVDAFPWGEYWGAELNPRFAAIPGYDERVTAGVLGGPIAEEPPAGDPVVALWALLYDDPTIELRVLAAGITRSATARQSDASVILARAVHLLAQQPPQVPLAELLAEGGIAATFDAAVQRAAALFQSPDPQIKAALLGITDQELEPYRSALARAIVAAAMRAALAAGSYPELFVDSSLRDHTVAAVEQALGAAPGCWAVRG